MPRRRETASADVLGDTSQNIACSVEFAILSKSAHILDTYDTFLTNHDRGKSFTQDRGNTV